MLRYIPSDELEGLMRRFRRFLGFDNVTYLDPMTVMTKLKAEFPDMDYERVPTASMPRAEAQWDSGGRVLRIREDTFEGMQHPNPVARSRFAFFHEIQHFVFQHEGIRNRSSSITIAEIANYHVKRDEREANRATAVFMAPRHLVKPNESVDGISFRFGMSRQAAEIRREELDRLERADSGQLRKLPQTAIDYLREKQKEGYKVQTRLDED